MRFKYSPNDTSFIFHALGLAFMVMAIMFAYQPYMGNDPKLAAIQQMDKTIVDVPAGNLKNTMAAVSETPVMLVLYASWCGYCKQVMPVVVDMVRNHELGNITPFFLSIDDQPRLLSKYLVHQGYDGVYTPYRLAHGVMAGSLKDFIEETGSHFRGAIPYIGFFSHDGRLISDASGVVKKEDIVSILNKIR